MTVGRGNSNRNTNSAVGYQALYTNAPTGNYNTAIGYSGLYNNTTGSSNTALGYFAGQFNKTGTFNTYLGSGTDIDSSANSWTRSTAIGANAKITASNQVMLGTSMEMVYVPGKFYVVGDASFNGRVDICGNFYAQYPAASIPSSAISGGVIPDYTTTMLVVSNGIRIGGGDLSMNQNSTIYQF
jgi:hypothetical protein